MQPVQSEYGSSTKLLGTQLLAFCFISQWWILFLTHSPSWLLELLVPGVRRYKRSVSKLSQLLFWGIIALQCCLFLLFNEVNQLYVYIYALPHEPPSHPHAISHPSRSSQSTELSSLCCKLLVLPTSCLFYAWQCIYVSPNIPVDLTLPFPPCPHICSLHLPLYSSPGNRSSSTIFLGFKHMC